MSEELTPPSSWAGRANQRFRHLPHVALCSTASDLAVGAARAGVFSPVSMD